MSSGQPRRASAAPRVSSLDLFAVPAVFTQDPLLDTGQSIDEAMERGRQPATITFPQVRATSITAAVTSGLTSVSRFGPTQATKPYRRPASAIRRSHATRPHHTRLTTTTRRAGQLHAIDPI